MKPLTIKIELLSPLSIPSESRSSFPSCNDYISGSLLRGALASQYLREKTSDSFFEQVFLKDNVFGNLYPTNFDLETNLFPSSTISCKRYGLEHGTKDNLWLFAAQNLYYKKTNKLKNFDKAYVCNNGSCKHDLKPQSGFYQIKDKKTKSIKINKQVHIHTGINRDTGNVQDGVFYGLEEITPYFDKEKNKIFFEGTIFIEDSLVSTFKDFFEDQIFFIGSNKTRGNGRVKIKSIIEKVTNKDLDNRLDFFNQEYQKYLDKEFGLSLSDYFFFSVDFVSDAILVDKFLRYQNIPEELSNLDLVFQSTSSIMIKGWNSFWKLPKEHELAVKKGSCYVFSILKKDFAPFKNNFEFWEKTGFGLRKEEGFGQVFISSPFHIDNAIRGIN